MAERRTKSSVCCLVPVINQIYLMAVMFTTVGKSFILPKNQMLQNGFLIFLMLR